MYGKLYENDKVHSYPTYTFRQNDKILIKFILTDVMYFDRPEKYNPTDYIYCSVCDSLVFIPRGYVFNRRNQDNHLKRCISGNTISNEHARRNEILKSIDTREFQIWQYKQYILQEEANIIRLRLELFSQSTSHSEKNKLASVSYDHDANFTASYENYAQSKAKDTMPSAPSFDPTYIPPARQEMVSPISHQSSNSKSNTSEIFISSWYAKQNNLLPSINNHNQPALRLRDGTKITFV
ncbi:hypothetical protein RhiirA5_429169 [Rhizophagus irregularis]|uniref:Uncharacterized protein n=1 Tax=Rhizophagus irregularis TaxID=588596 RepID=A0A2N0NYY8_9GLOM|nr:hypothetical protein RhiirA5_429169 [Rhizophagus irregularis]CAB4494759.1 unnamed protein product [Rhizophagus irregularis]